MVRADCGADGHHRLWVRDARLCWADFTQQQLPTRVSGKFIMEDLTAQITFGNQLLAPHSSDCGRIVHGLAATGSRCDNAVRRDRLC